MVTIALDSKVEFALPFIAAAAPTHPSLIDTAHLTNERLGFTNVPMAVWVDENGTIVRPSEQASIETSPSRQGPIPEGLPERLRMMMAEVRTIPDNSVAYRAAVIDWVTNGAKSRYALTPDEVIARSQPYVYAGNWLDDVLAAGGGKAYYPPLDLD